jgi:hypothetical protein
MGLKQKKRCNSCWIDVNYITISIIKINYYNLKHRWMVDHLYSYRALTYMGKSDHVMYVILSPPKSTFSCIHQPNTNYAHSHITVLLSCDLVTCTLVSHSHSILLSISTMHSVGLWERGSARWMCICMHRVKCLCWYFIRSI